MVTKLDLCLTPLYRNVFERFQKIMATKSRNSTAYIGVYSVLEIWLSKIKSVEFVLNPKNIFTGSLLVAYLLVGSGHYVTKTPKYDAHRDTAAFASTLPRKIYRYSVVPGGVNSPEELAAARRSDPVVAAHFADFGKNTWLTTLKEDMYVYVSYRKGDQVRYTKKKHKVCKGEVVITDGTNYARTRCANRITRVFRPPALAFDEPTPPQFDYIDPPSSPDVNPGDPALTSNYYDLPTGTGYNPPLQAQTGANPGPPPPGKAFDSSQSEVIYPQAVPLASGPPGLLRPNIPQTVVTPPPPVVIPEPAEWPFVFASSMVLLLLGRRRVAKT
jgi:hypothetical protein